MEITSADSLMLSWLKHIENCQVTQKNWKAAYHSWELQNEDDIRSLIEYTGKLFFENDHLNIYDNTRTQFQYLKQGQIDILGIRMISGGISNIYGVVSNYQEKRFNYGNELNPVQETIKKMIRTALLILGYFNTSEAEIIFATPKIHNELYNSLIDAVDQLNDIFQSMGLRYSFVLFHNEDFREIIFEPVINLPKEYSDESELFLQSIELYNDTLLKKPSINSFSVDYRNNGTNSSQTTMKIGKFVRVEFEKLIEKGVITDEVVENLCSSKYSKEILGLRFPMLKIYIDEQSLIDQRLVKGNGRYYSHIYYINGGKYLLTNDWYEKNRDKLINWINTLKTKS